MNLTTVVIMLAAFTLGAYDIYTGVRYGSETTISWDIWQASQRWPTIAFAAGYLCGHLFAQMHGTNMGMRP